MLRILRWFFITLVLVALALGLAFGLKQAQNKYCPAYQSDQVVANKA